MIPVKQFASLLVETVEFRCAAALLLAISAAPAHAQSVRDFFDDSSIQDVQLTVAPDDWATLKKNYMADTYYPATFAWKGITQSISIRSRGRGSRSPDKPNLDLNFAKPNKAQTFLGLTMVVLKANNQDASMLRERLTMLMFRRMGFPAPREAPARLFINGEYFGFYSVVEHVDEVFLQRNFGESGGYLYDWKPNQFYHFEYLGDDPALYSPISWEPKNHDNNPDPAPIVGMVRAVNFSSDTDFDSQVSQYLNLRLFMSYVAIENFQGDIDGVLGDVYGMNNFYFYRFQGTLLSQFIPWDKDLTFMDPQRNITQGLADNVLGRRAFAIPELRNIYLTTLLRAADMAGGPDGWLAQELEREYTQIRDIARNDPHKQRIENGGMIPAGPDDFEAEVVKLRTFAASRQAFVTTAVEAAGYPAPSGMPVLAEAVNTASNLVGVLAAGSLVTLYGDGFSNDTAQAAGYPLPLELAGANVLVNGARAPLLYVSPGQVNIQIPWDISIGDASIAVSVSGKTSNAVIQPAGDYSPGIFLVAHSADQSKVTQDHPASVGERLTIYATGLGPTVQIVPTGQLPLTDLPAAQQLPAVTIAEVPATVVSCNLSPDLVGVYVLTVDVPATSLAGAASLVITSGGASTAVMIAIQ